MKRMLNLIRQMKQSLENVESYFIGRVAAASQLEAAFDYDSVTGTYILHDDSETAIDYIMGQSGKEGLLRLKEGSITKRKDGRWHAKYYDDGVRKNVYAATKKECIAKLNKALIERDRRERDFAISKRVTLSAWIDRWLALKNGKLKESTKEDYEMNLVRKVNTHSIGNKKLSHITPIEIERFLQKIKAPSARARTFRHLKACFAGAVKYKVIKESPFEFIDGIPEPKNNKHIPSDKDLERLYSYLIEQNPDMYRFVRFIALTGLRKGEALALEWRDITDRISISKAYNVQSGTVQSPKTQASNRFVPLFPEARAILNDIPRTHADVFHSIYKNAITKRFRIYCNRLGLDGLTLHSLRHYFATQCLEAGIERKLVQMWLGHSKYEVTINTYSHINRDFEDKEIEKITNYRQKKE